MINQPDEQEILDILKAAVHQKNYEHFTLLEKRVIQSICIEKLIQEQRMDNLLS